MGTLVEITSHGDQAGLRIVRLRHPMPDDRLYQRTLSERLQEITRFEHLRPPTPLQAILRNPVKAPALFFPKLPFTGPGLEPGQRDRPHGVRWKPEPAGRGRGPCLPHWPVIRTLDDLLTIVFAENNSRLDRSASGVHSSSSQTDRYARKHGILSGPWTSKPYRPVRVEYRHSQSRPEQHARGLLVHGGTYGPTQQTDPTQTASSSAGAFHSAARHRCQGWLVRMRSWRG